jgi:hypothetical protein
MSILRSIFAVLAGFLTMAIIVMALTPVTVKLMHLKTGAPTAGYLALNVAYSLAAAFAAGYVTARIAACHPIQYGIALAVLMALMSVVSYFHYRGQQPVWYQSLLCVVPPVCAIAGASPVRN